MTHRAEPILREGLRRFHAGDEAALAELYHPDVEVWSGQGNTGTFHGREAVLQWGRDWNDAWEEVSYEPIEFIELTDDMVVVPFRIKARARHGLELEDEFAWLFELEGDLLRRWEMHGDRHEALASARTWLAGQTRE